MGAAAPAEITAEQLVQRARALRPELVGQQAETEERTHFSPLLHRALSAFTALHDWGDSLGLKGTGSDTIRCDGAVVPANAVLEGVNMIDVRVEDSTPGVALHGNPMYGAAAVRLPRRERRLPALVRRRARQVQTAEAAMMRCAEEHMELCASSAAGESPYTWAQDARPAAIARETMVQAWEAVEQHLLRTIGSSAVKHGQRFERLFRDLATMAAHRNTMLREDFWRQLGAIDLGVSYPRPGGTWPPSPDTTARDRV